MLVVKVGGSLYDHPRLREGLNEWLSARRSPVLLVPGGGAFADAVRALDRCHQLGDGPSHWIALQATSAAAGFLRAIVPEAVPVKHPGASFHLGVLDPAEFCQFDRGYTGSLPESWDVGTDCVAARAATVFRADRLILLKSIAIPEMPWAAAAEQGFVDRYFPTAIGRPRFDVEAIHFRRWLDQLP